MSLTKDLLIQIFIGLLLFEILSFIGTKNELFLVNDTPAIYRFSDKSEQQGSNMNITENQLWGAWRKVNSKSRQITNCFDVEISANEVGARDASFKNQSNKNIILLGDSFAEGFGVSYKDTAQYLIELHLGTKVLNFGTSGNFGPLQELIIYKDLASNYKHEQILIFVLPANDFIDNERQYFKDSSQSRQRFRPYYSIEGDPTLPWYFPESNSIEILERDEGVKSSQLPRQFLSIIKNWLVDYTWSSNALRTASFLLFERDLTTGSYYISALNDEQENLIASYQKVADLAVNKPVNFVIIPTQRDIAILKSLDNFKEILLEQYWYRELRRISESSGGVFIDLLDHTPGDTDLFFHSCDSHWSIAGNQWAAEIIAEQITNIPFVPIE